MADEVQNVLHFVATYADGRQVFQTPEDVSQHTPGKNAFFDVLNCEEQPVSFVIRNEEHSFGVDLRDGHFECNGVPFFQHRPEHKKYRDFKLVYWRITDQLMEINTETQERTPIGARVAGYVIGWECQHDGERVERTFNVYLN